MRMVILGNNQQKIRNKGGPALTETRQAPLEISGSQFAAVGEILKQCGGDVDLLRQWVDAGQGRLSVSDVVVLFKAGLLDREEARMLCGVRAAVEEEEEAGRYAEVPNPSEVQLRATSGLRSAAIRWGLEGAEAQAFKALG
jgi:hypothetical protein